MVSLLRPDQIPANYPRDNQLKCVDVARAIFKWNNGIACNLKEVAVATGYDYWKIRRLNLPLFESKITQREFNAWKLWQKRKANRLQRQSGEREDQSPGPATAAQKRRLTADRSGGSRCSRD